MHKVIVSLAFLLVTSLCFGQRIDADTGVFYIVNNHLWRGARSPLKYIAPEDVITHAWMDTVLNPMPKFLREQRKRMMCVAVIRGKYEKLILDSSYKTNIPTNYKTVAKHDLSPGGKRTDSISKIVNFTKEGVNLDNRYYTMVDIPVSFDSDVVYFCSYREKKVRIDLDYDRDRREKGWYHAMVSSSEGIWYWDMVAESR